MHHFFETRCVIIFVTIYVQICENYKFNFYILRPCVLILCFGIVMMRYKSQILAVQRTRRESPVSRHLRNLTSFVMKSTLQYRWPKH